MADNVEAFPTDPQRVRAFASFFKNYMSVSTVVAAALPIPVTAMGAIPTFKVQTKLLAIYTPVFCFLLLGFAFYSRHSIARLIFPPAELKPDEKVTLELWPGKRRLLMSFLPLFMIFGCMYFIFSYHSTMAEQISVLAENTTYHRVATTASLAGKSITDTGYLARRAEDETISDFFRRVADDENLIYGPELMVDYIGIFACAELAFILMALREYLQDVLHLDEATLMGRGAPPIASEKSPSA